MSDNFEIELVVYPDGSIAIVAVTYERRDIGSEVVGEPIYEFANARALANELDRLRPERPSCATCEWAVKCATDDMVWCARVKMFVVCEQTDGVCLWEAKCPA